MVVHMRLGWEIDLYIYSHFYTTEESWDLTEQTPGAAERIIRLKVRDETCVNERI